MATKERSGRKPPPKKPKNLTERVIRQHVGDRSFRLGEDYFQQGAVFDCRRQQSLLKARCQGRSADYYVVEARVEGGRVEEAECSCPVGGGGFCKHVGALLLSWLHAPEEFRETEPAEKLLARCTKEQLIGLIEQMLQQEPELESWLEVALPNPGKKGAVIDAAAYRDRAAAAFQSAGYGWEADRQVTDALATLKQIGDGHLNRKEFETAAAVYRGILEGFVENYETFHDETGNVGSVAQQCIEGLGSCMPHLKESPEARQSALRALFEVLKFDVEFGGIGLSDDVPDIFADQATPEERATVAGWIREVMPKGDDFSTSWRRQTFGGLLLDLESPADDEAYLAHCRRFNLTGDLVNRLLKLRRLDEAVAEIKQAPVHALPGYADLLVSHKQSERALALVRDRLLREKDESSRPHLVEWLERFYAARKDWQAVLDLTLEQFRKDPGLSGYQEVRKYAKKLKNWKSLRPEIMEIARGARSPSELIRIHLLEGEVSQAIDLLKSPSLCRQRGGWGWDAVDLDVAKAAEKTHPEAAVEIYSKHAQDLIGLRGRGNYEAACKYLKKVRELYRKLKQTADWDKLITAIRQANPTLRALRQELDRARL